jgi:hypothetical protein
MYFAVQSMWKREQYTRRNIMETPMASGSPILAFAEWVMVLPATIFLAAGVLRSLQPAEYEPARTSWVIFNWAGAHMTRTGAAMLFLALPALVLAIGWAIMVRTWVRDEAFRDGVREAMATLRRYASVVFVAGATALAGAIFLFAVVHLLMD